MPRASDASRGARAVTDASGDYAAAYGTFQGDDKPAGQASGSSAATGNDEKDKDARGRPSAPEDGVAACGDESLPLLHPDSARTSRWRKLMFELFNRKSLKEQLEAGEIWRLPQGLTSARASSDFAKVYVPGSCFSLKTAVMRAHWRQLVVCWLLELGSLTFATMTPIILYAVLQTAVSGEDRLLRVGVKLVLLYATSLAEIVMHCHSRFLGFKINVQITGALRTLLFETTLSNGSRGEACPGGFSSFLCGPSRNESTAASLDGSRRDSMKKRMAEVAHMYSHDVVMAAEMTTMMPVVWRTSMQIAIQLYILVQVIGISVKPIFIALGVIGIVLKLGSQFTGGVQKKLTRVIEARLNVLHECFKSIQMIKLNAWEDKIIHKIDNARKRENKFRRSMSAARALQHCIGADSPNLASIMVFAWMAMQQDEFSPAQVFPALLLFRRIKDDFKSIMGLIDLTTAGHTSFWKLSTYFSEYSRSNESRDGESGDARRSQKADQEHKTEPSRLGSGSVIFMDQACFAPTADASKPLLFNVTLSIPKGALVVVQGKAGAGKSTLLSAILGDVESVYGDVIVNDKAKVAYCAQEAWLQTLSIRENILFGSTLNEHKYRCVLEACCLVEDLRSLPNGDSTMVGPKGINLSGGQKARIAFARACYADADLYLLDCPFASVDPIVQNEIFAKCIVDLLRYKTVVLVTHNPELASSDFVDQLVTVDNMTVQVQQHQVAGRRHQDSGNSNRSSRRTDAANSLPPWKRPAAESSKENDPLQTPTELYLWEPSVSLSTISVATLKSLDTIEDVFTSKTKKASIATADMTPCSLFERKDESRTKVDLFTRDKLATVFNGHTMRYMIPGKIFLVLYAIASTAKDIWLMSWSASSTPTKIDMLRSVNIYASLVVGSVVFGVLSTILHMKALSIAANELFHDMTVALVRAPMSFFYRTPVGEIFSRYFHDMRIVDTDFIDSFLAVFRSAITIIASDVMVWYYTGLAGTGVLLIFFIAMKQFVSLGYAAALLQRSFQTEAANLNLISEALDGSTTIRAFGRAQVSRFCSQHGFISDELLRGRYHAEAFKCFVLVRCDRSLGLHLIIILVLLSTHKIAPAELGLLLYYVFSITSDVFTLTTQMLQSIRCRFSIDRIVEYTAIPPEEAPLTPQQEQQQKLPTPVKPVEPTAAWPKKGDVVFDHVWFAYSASSKSGARDSQGALALQDVSFSVRGGEKIGVVGRTGSGKSSLAMALFRVHALQRGRILVDDVDVSTMRLDKLRRNVCILPQTPLFYRCSVRGYLDPFNEREDDDLWRVLMQCGLESSVRTLEGEMLTDNGENWSGGERQKLCLARAALSPSRVVILDESFSAVDQAGQAELLSVLDTVFAHSTIFLITHRLEEILGFDRILVMRDGRAVEFGAADELAANPDSAFYEFLETTLLTF
jgi:ABC-type multidrug transport system fused ATPase/permease subunit